MTYPYLDYTGRDDVLTGGVKMIPIQTEKGTFRVWTKRTGNAPGKKVLLLHGGPGGTHEYLEAFDSYFPARGDRVLLLRPAWTRTTATSRMSPTCGPSPRFVDEIEEVRVALDLDAGNFFLYGHSWGGILALEYALAYQQHLKGLIISNTMASIRRRRFCRIDHAAGNGRRGTHRTRGIGGGRGLREPALRYAGVGSTSTVKHMLRLPPDAWPEPMMTVGAAPEPRPTDRQMSGQKCTSTTAASSGSWDRSADLAQLGGARP